MSTRRVKKNHCPSCTRLLKRVQEDSNGSVGVNELFNAYEFEMKECSAHVIASKRIFIEHILKVYPIAERKRFNNAQKTTVTQYRGISLLPVEMTQPVKNVDFANVKQCLTDDTCITFVEGNSNSVRCSLETTYRSNGNRVVKHITFLKNGEWTLDISGEHIDLDQVQISNKFQSDSRGIQCVLKAARKVQLCEGVTVSNHVIMTRFHTLETWTDTSKSTNSRILRSKLCNRVTPFTAMNNTCLKCQRMTMYRQTDKEDKENGPTSEEGTSSSNKGTSKAPTKEDVKKFIPGATDEMVELILSQANNASKDPRGRRWTDGMITVCLQWYCRSPQSYEQFRDSHYLILPSKSTLIQYKNRVKQHAGFQDNVFDWMLDEAKRKEIPEEGYTGGIIIDEMAIQSDIQICKNGDIIELTGFMDVGEEGNLCNIMRKGTNEKILGTHALQFVFLGINGFRFPFAHFVSDGVQAPELYPLFWEAVDRLRLYGFKAVYTCMDGAQSNRTFMHMNTSAEQLFTSDCPCSFGKMIFIMDSKHVIKKIRNNVIKSGLLKTSTRLLTLPNDQTIQWQMFIDCHKWDKSNCLQLHRKLTNDHMFPSNQLKMRNHLAEEVLDSDMLHVMLQYQQSLGAKGSVLDGSIDMLRQTSNLIAIFKDMRPVKSLQDPRLNELMTIARWFEDWKDTSISDKTVPSKDKHKKIMSLQCHEDIQACIIGFCQVCKLLLTEKNTIFITPGLINSDVIENTFNQQRSTYHGANSNPNALQYRQALNSIVLGQNTVSQKANAGKNRSAAVPYNCSLQKAAQAPKRNSSQKQYEKIKVVRM